MSSLISSQILLAESKTEKSKNLIKSSNQNQNNQVYVWDIVWFNVAFLSYFYFCGIYGLYLAITSAKFATNLWSILLMVCGALGTTAGSHRLWSHRTYKANLPLRIILAFFATISFQNHIYEWVRDHRVHHKHTDTDADPHNSSRGFFFSHCGWLMVRKHKDVIAKGKKIDLSDLEKDPVVMFQKKYYAILMPLLCFILPSVIPWYFWNETGVVSYYVAGVGKYIWAVNGTWLVNSAAHLYGTKPYDKNINPSENTFVGYLALGEGWHNYHHTFPWDYKTSEFANYGPNLTTAFIDFFAWLGWAYDLKTASEEMVRRRMLRTGDGTKLPPEEIGKKSSLKEDLGLSSDNIWGWGDINMKSVDFQYVKRFNVK
nr:acyl-CoA Delta(11) desaturase-like [Onthophagus taurus]